MEYDPERAILFESAAGKYHLYRPGYPDSIIVQLIELAGLSAQSRLLEIGCGTGKATEMLAHRGYAIDCLDPGENLLSIAREVCRGWPRVSFMLGRFEELDLKQHYYDLIYSAQAFHWVDPSVRWEKCDRCLVEGGSIGLIYNYSILPESDVEIRLSEVIQREGGDSVRPPQDYEESISKWEREIAASGRFGSVTVRRQKWSRRYHTAEYIGLFETFSDYLSFPLAVRERIARGMSSILTENGGFIDHRYETVLLFARKVAQDLSSGGRPK